MNGVNITPYERSHQQAVLDLVFQSTAVHTHFDWCDTAQWLRTPGAIIRLAWQHTRLLGILGASPSLNGYSWLRLLAFTDDIPTQAIIGLLWEAMSDEMIADGSQQCAVLLAENWPTRYLPALGFAYQEDIITLCRGRSRPIEPQPSPATIHIADNDDLGVMAEIDLAAFSPLWQMSHLEIYQAYRIAAASTVALINDTVIGFQISTVYQDRAHLARLAILPDAQGQGIGSALITDLIERFHRRRVYTLTVNTQESNLRSQRLYQRFNFKRNGYDLPIWIAQLKGERS